MYVCMCREREPTPSSLFAQGGASIAGDRRCAHRLLRTRRHAGRLERRQAHGRRDYGLT